MSLPTAELRQISSWITTAAILLALAVIIGAFGAHGLEGVLDAKAKSQYQTGVFYHCIHALGMLATCALAPALPTSVINRVCRLLGLGICLFSGSLYLLSVTGITKLGMVTPVGGLLFIVAWTLLAFGIRKSYEAA